MKIISLLQPWATLLVQGHKMVETRSWFTNYRGPIFIHASGSLNKRYTGMEYYTPALMSFEPFFKDFIKNPETLPFGKIIGMVEIATNIRTEDIKPLLSPQELAFGDYTKGRWAWECRNAVEFKHHTQVKGQLGIRDYKGETHCDKCDEGQIPTAGWHYEGLSVFLCNNVDENQIKNLNAII